MRQQYVFHLLRRISGIEFYIQIDPRLLAISEDLPEAQYNLEDVAELVDSEDDGNEPANLEDEDERSIDQFNNKNKQVTKERVVVSGKNAAFGFVQGVKKGSLDFSMLFQFNFIKILIYILLEIARPRPLRGKIDDIAKSTTRYRRELPLIISRVGFAYLWDQL